MRHANTRRLMRGRALLGALLLVLAASLQPAEAPAATTTSAEEAALIRAACALPHPWLVRIWRGTTLDRGGEILIVPKAPNFMSGGLSHAGPWPYVQDVPILWYGPGYVAPVGKVARPVTSADIAPTEAALLDFTKFHAPDGHPMTEALLPADRRPVPPRLIVTLVWDAAGLDVLDQWPHAWPYLRSLIPKGAWYEHATAGSSPSNTPPIHATIGTGAFPLHHGVLEEFVKVDNQIEKPNQFGTNLLVEPTLADLYDRDMGNKPKVGIIATLSAHTGMIGHGSLWGGGDKDIAVTRELPNAPTAGAEADTWNLTDKMQQYFRFPSYVNQVPGFENDVRALDQADGALDGMWRQDSISRLSDGFDTPARDPYETRVIETMMRREGFGKDNIPDLFFINYKTIDTIGHLFSLNGVEMLDSVRAQDESLRTFVYFLNQWVGKGRWAMVVTADHGHQYDPAVSGAFPIDVDKMYANLNAFFDHDTDNVPVVQKIRPTEIWVDTRDLARNGFTLDDMAAHLIQLTQAQTPKIGETPIPGHENDTVLSAAFPSTILAKLPCLPEAHAG